MRIAVSDGVKMNAGIMKMVLSRPPYLGAGAESARARNKACKDSEEKVIDVTKFIITRWIII